jgi:hypothetical protein
MLRSPPIDLPHTSQKIGTHPTISTMAKGNIEAGSGLERSVKAPKPRWCPAELNKTQCGRLQKVCKKEIESKKAEDAQDEWFNQTWMMTSLKTWREKRLAREEHSDDDTGRESSGDADVNMVFVLPAKFRAPEKEVTELVLGAKKVSFEKPKKLGQHMRPLFVQGHIEGRPILKIMVDRGAGVNVMSLATFK